MGKYRRWSCRQGHAVKKDKKAEDHYILFCDISDDAPSTIGYDRNKQRDGLSGNYVWDYIGELSGDQAKEAQDELDSRYKAHFEMEFMEFYRLGEINRVVDAIEVTPHLPAALDFLAHLLPNSASFEHVPLNQPVKIRPKSKKEENWVLATLRSYPQGVPDLCFSYKIVSGLDIPKMNRSFIELISLTKLRKSWQRDGCFPEMDPLRRTAAIWVSEKKKLANSKIYPSGEKFRPEHTEIIFKSALDSEEYRLALTDRQKDILRECVEIVKRVRSADGCKDNFENKYAAMRWKNDDDCSTYFFQIQPAKNASKETNPPPEPANAKRDARILELRQLDIPFKEVCNTINKEFKGEMLDEKSAYEALDRYCERNQIPYPYGKRGRKPAT